AELLVKVAEYDKNFVARAGDKVHVLLVVSPGNPESARIASQMERALGRIDTISGLAHDETTWSFTGAAELAALCRAQRIALVFFAPGFQGMVASIANALSGADVLT